MPFGEELFAGTGGRATAQGYIASDEIRQKFTQKERDDETGLDYFGARYFSNSQGRFSSVDEFWKDSHVGDPQSWNKYAYARNNPLKYFDPTGEKATVTIETDEEHKRAKITVTATIAIWTQNNRLSKQLQKAAEQYKKNIEKAWSGSFEHKGVKVEVNTTVSVQVYGGKEEATKSGAQNVLEVVPSGADSQIDPRINPLSNGPDTGSIEINAGERGVAAHEFTHMLGVSDRFSGAYLSNTNEDQRSPDMVATANDYAWAFGGAIDWHRNESRPINPVPLGILNRAPAARGYGNYQNFTSTQTLHAGPWWH